MAMCTCSLVVHDTLHVQHLVHQASPTLHHPGPEQVLVTDDHGGVAIYQMDSGDLVATKQLTDDFIVSIRQCLDNSCYAVVTATGLHVWQLTRNAMYGMLRGGHSKPIITIHACSTAQQVTLKKHYACRKT